MPNPKNPFSTTPNALIGVLMGSPSDWPTMQKCAKTLDQLAIPHECNAISAHRSPDLLHAYLQSAETRNIKIFICAAGGAAHLAGVVASQTSRPVLGCPMPAWSLDGMDSLLSTVQMPKGIPVATFAIGAPGAVNAALFAAAILALENNDIKTALESFRKDQANTIQPLPTSCSN